LSSRQNLIFDIHKIQDGDGFATGEKVIIRFKNNKKGKKNYTS
jgi:hypothetical protein